MEKQKKFHLTTVRDFQVRCIKSLVFEFFFFGGGERRFISSNCDQYLLTLLGRTKNVKNPIKLQLFVSRMISTYTNTCRFTIIVKFSSFNRISIFDPRYPVFRCFHKRFFLSTLTYTPKSFDSFNRCSVLLT